MQPAVDVRKVTLIGLKQKLLDDLDYCENQIAEAKKELAKPKSTYNDSSDSECELALNVASGPSIPCLKYIQTKLQICLKATQELTGLQILQSEVNILVDDPVIVGEPEVTQRGTWKEVTVECRVDLVTFTMSFYVHQPKCNCGQPSYRSLKVAAVKTAQDKELSKSILADVTTPSEAFEVIKSYATAHRSRRTTLASLAEKYGENLFMMPLADGGYQLKCANVMEVSWVLKNNTSPISAFHHQMKFDLEYIDKKYLDIITQANKKLCNPSIDTDERTSLLSTIISSCLEAQAISVQTGSDSESSRAEKRPANTEAEVPAKKRKDAEVMAPPKTLPKKFEAKGKKNKLQNRTNKSAIVEDKEKMPENKRNTDKALGGKNRLSVNVVRLNIKKHVVTQDKETTQAKECEESASELEEDFAENKSKDNGVEDSKVSGQQQPLVRHETS
ncbi:uncharacterized protein [Battus philenor]|uniref:uncharacterized protein isoform X2 n=1 Tax=Battus philenor TaxID=42288 RepID=UPI0035D02EED